MYIIILNLDKTVHNDVIDKADLYYVVDSLKNSIKSLVAFSKEIEAKIKKD